MTSMLRPIFAMQYFPRSTAAATAFDEEITVMDRKWGDAVSIMRRAKCCVKKRAA